MIFILGGSKSHQYASSEIVIFTEKSKKYWIDQQIKARSAEVFIIIK